MNRLFEPIPFAGKPLVWNFHNVNTEPFDGFYHWHQCVEILIIHQGTGLVAFNRQSCEIRPGMLFFFQPFELHKVYAHITEGHPYERTVLHVDPIVMASHLLSFPRRHDLFTQLWKAPSVNRAFELGEETERVNEAIFLYERARRNGWGDHVEEIHLLLLQLLSSLQAAGKRPEDRERLVHRPERYSEKIMRWLEEHYSDEFVLERLAAELHLSKFYVSRLFREETGSSITEYLTARRIMQACHLLEATSFSVERICSEVGLSNTSHFIHTFKKTVGLTPLKYRHAKKAPPY